MNGARSRPPSIWTSPAELHLFDSPMSGTSPIGYLNHRTSSTTIGSKAKIRHRDRTQVSGSNRSSICVRLLLSESGPVCSALCSHEWNGWAAL